MKKIITVFIFIALYSCNLEEKVYSELLEETYEFGADEIYGIIGPCYSSLRGLFSNVNTRYYITQEITTDESVRPANASGWDNAGIWRVLHQHNWTTELWQLNDSWEYLYMGAIHSTRIIELLQQEDRVPMPSGVNRESLIAEMKVARAFYHWLILDNFGDAPIVKTISQTLPDNTPRENIFQFVIDEINSALPYLSEEKGGKMYGRFNKWAAKSLLANIYLNAEVYTGHAYWDTVIDICNEIINSNLYELDSDYRDFWATHNEGSLENIFVVPFHETLATGFQAHNISLHASNRATYNLMSSPFGAGGFCAVPQFIDTYDPEDKRLGYTWIIGPQYASDGVTPVYCSYEKVGQPLVYTKELPDGIYQGENEGYRAGKWEVAKGARGQLNNDFPVFRYAGTLMMKAEALLRSGKSDQAAEIVTIVRQRAFDDPKKAKVTGSQLEEDSSYEWGYVENYEIVEPGNQDPVQYGRFYDELGWEFALETTRRRDMIRFGTFTKKSWLSHKPNGEYRTIFPIIQRAIDANPNLKQNPNY
ncbi:MAG: RagB/SusD family nutrient uptake outer membrane protein [Fermentimonas sp.]